MVAGPFVAQRALDDDEIGRRSGRDDLPGRGEAYQHPAAAREQLFRDQDGKGGTDRAADDPDGLIAEHEGIERGVIAGPALERLRHAGVAQPANDIAVGIENADSAAPRRLRAPFAAVPRAAAPAARTPKARRRACCREWAACSRPICAQANAAAWKCGCRTLAASVMGAAKIEPQWRCRPPRALQAERAAPIVL